MLLDNENHNLKIHEWIVKYTQTGQMSVVTGYFTVGAWAYLAKQTQDKINAYKFILGDIMNVIVSFNKPDNAQKIYKERRQIETAFRALKSSGFNMKNTHLTDIDRVDKLFAMVITAFTWAYIVGIYVHENLKQLKIKKHGRREKSLFKYGLGVIANLLLNSQKNIK